MWSFIVALAFTASRSFPLAGADHQIAVSDSNKLLNVTPDQSLLEVDNSSKLYQQATEPKRIKGPLKMVANCPRCRMQAVPEMCQYLAGTEPPGLRFDDVMSSSPASIRTATARPGQVSHADRADGGALAQPQKRQNSLGLSRQRHQGTTEKAAGAWAAGGQERQMRLPGATASFTVRTTANNKRIANVGEVKKALMDSGVSKDRSRGYLSAIMQKLRQAAHSGGKTEGNHTSVVAEPTAVSRRLLRVAVKRGPQARQPIFSPPGPRVASLTRQVLSEWRQNPERCGIWTKDCVRRYMAGDDLGLRTSFRNETELGRRHPLKKVFVNNEIPNVKSVPDLFPDLKPGSLGSCAVVAVGDNMLHQGRGWQIDAHDTVWRYNSPMNNFKRDIGKKSDVIYWKMRKDEKDYGQEDQVIRPAPAALGRTPGRVQGKWDGRLRRGRRNLPGRRTADVPRGSPLSFPFSAHLSVGASHALEESRSPPCRSCWCLPR